MSAALFDPDAIIREVRAKANLSPPATIATLRQNAVQCRNVAIVATPCAPIDAGDEAEAGIFPPLAEEAESVRDAIEERAALCAGIVPAPYLDAWARLNHQKPMGVSEADWNRAVDDGGRFLDRWGREAAEWGWTAGELFDVPREGHAGGLIWRLAGRAAISYGPDYVRLDDDDDTVIERGR